VDLQNDPALGVAILSISFDPAEQQQGVKEEYGITVPMLVDADHAVSEAYDVLQWAVASGEPGHTFILVGADDTIKWVRDYGAPQNGGLMYVPVDELVEQIEANLP